MVIVVPITILHRKTLTKYKKPVSQKMRYYGETGILKETIGIHEVGYLNYLWVSFVGFSPSDSGTQNASKAWGNLAGQNPSSLQRGREKWESVQIYKFTQSASEVPNMQVQQQWVFLDFFANFMAEIVWQNKLQQIWFKIFRLPKPFFVKLNKAVGTQPLQRLN